MKYMHIWLHCGNVFVNLFFDFVMQLSDLKSELHFLFLCKMNNIYVNILQVFLFSILLKTKV